MIREGLRSRKFEMMPTELKHDVGHNDFVNCVFQILIDKGKYKQNISISKNTLILVLYGDNIDIRRININKSKHIIMVSHFCSSTHLDLRLHLNDSDIKYTEIENIFLKKTKLTCIGIILENVSNRLREFKAIINVDSLKLKDVILNPKSVVLQQNNCVHSNSKKSWIWNQLPEAFKQRLKRYLNTSQLKSIQNACQNEGITLLQGPPGI